MEGQVVEPPLKTHRKHRRRPRYLANDHSLRQQDFKWLETHVWHAKRFKMTKVWGFTIAKHPRDRSGRAAYKALKRSAILYDCSFGKTLRIAGDRAAILNLLSRCTDASAFTFGSTMFSHGSRLGRAMIYHEGGTAPAKPIAPVQFLWREREIVLFVHPAAWEELAQMVSLLAPLTACVVVKDFQVVQFDLLGPQAHAVAQRILRPVDEGHIWNSMRGIGDASQLPSNFVLAIRVSDPRLATLHPRSEAPFQPPSVALFQQLVSSHHCDAPALWDTVGELPESQVCFFLIFLESIMHRF